MLRAARCKHGVEPSLHQQYAALCDWPYLCCLAVDARGLRVDCAWNVRGRVCLLAQIRVLLLQLGDVHAHRGSLGEAESALVPVPSVPLGLYSTLGAL
jgi:hypothetical protein